jgi:outer membrane protein OmpA-like peptidoglycan-associated protein
MKTLLATLLLAAAAVPAAAGPDFTASTEPTRPLAASAEVTHPILPSEDVVFQHNSFTLLNADIQQLDTVAAYMKSHKHVRLVLEGHANSLGSDAHNKELATSRADIVRQHLIGLGVPADRMMMIVFGEEGADKVASPLDRRVVLYATHDSTDKILSASLRRGSAMQAVWTKKGVLFTETHRGQPTATIATR